MKIAFKYLLLLSILSQIVSCHTKGQVAEQQSDCNFKFPHITISYGDSAIVKNSYSKASVSFTSENGCLTQNIDGYIKGRGNTTWAFPKKSFQIKFDTPTALLELPCSKKFVLIANYSDKSMLRNELAFELSRLSKLDWTPKSQYFELTINEKYWGVYQLVQKIEIAENALTTNKADILLEIDHLERLHSNDIYFKTKEHLFCLKDHSMNMQPSLDTIQDYFSRAEANVLNGHDIDQYYDITALVDWYIINEIAKNNDALFNSSVYLHYKINGQIQMGPVWDYDIAFGNINYNGNDSIQGFFIKNAKYFDALFKVKSFKALVKKRYEYFYSKKQYLLNMLTRNSELLKPAANRNFNKWQILGKYIWPNNVVEDSYQKEVEYLQFWLNARMDWLNEAYSKY